VPITAAAKTLTIFFFMMIFSPLLYFLFCCCLIYKCHYKNGKLNIKSCLCKMFVKKGMRLKKENEVHSLYTFWYIYIFLCSIYSRESGAGRHSARLRSPPDRFPLFP